MLLNSALLVLLVLARRMISWVRGCTTRHLIHLCNVEDTWCVLGHCWSVISVYVFRALQYGFIWSNATMTACCLCSVKAWYAFYVTLDMFITEKPCSCFGCNLTARGAIGVYCKHGNAHAILIFALSHKNKSTQIKYYSNVHLWNKSLKLQIKNKQICSKCPPAKITTFTV